MSLFAQNKQLFRYTLLMRIQIVFLKGRIPKFFLISLKDFEKCAEEVPCFSISEFHSAIQKYQPAKLVGPRKNKRIVMPLY